MGRRGEAMVAQEKGQLNSALRMESILFMGVCVCVCVSACMCVSVCPLTALNHLLHPVYTGSFEAACQQCSVLISC